MYRTIIFSGLIIGLSLFFGCRHAERNGSSPVGEISQNREPPTQHGQPDAAGTSADDTLVMRPDSRDTFSDGHPEKQSKKKKTRSLPAPQPFEPEVIQERIETIRRLKAMENEIDMASYRRSWKTRAGLDKHLNEELHLINPNVYFCINVENDVFTNTDRYYTNGIRFDWINPGLNRSFLTKLMIPLKNPARNYYGIKLVHRMYTPWDSHIDSITQGDRPFSSYLTIGYFKTSNSISKRYRQLSELNLGIIGSAALGKQIQQSIHFTEINGWKHQVSNAIILDYHFHSEAGLIKGKSFEIGALADANAGTLYDRIGIGPFLIAGKYDPVSLDQVADGTWGQINPTSGNVQYFLYYRFMATLVGYDATLQGGVFSESEYTLDASQINHFTYDQCLGLAVSFRRASVLAEYTRLSPEYKGCDSHAWMRINLTFTL